MAPLLSIAQIVISLLLTGAILLQQRGSGLGGGAFGGSGGGMLYSSRRGIERVLFWATIALALLFLGVTFAHLFIR